MKRTMLLLLVLVFAQFTMAQLTGSYTYDFRDGTIIANGQSNDGKLTLSGQYKHHSANYGLNMKVDGEISIAVDGSSTIRFTGSKHSGLKMEGTALEPGDLGEQNTKVVNDLTDVFDFVYYGIAANLTFKTTAGTGNDLYLPLIEVIPVQEGSTANAAAKNIQYRFDLRNGSIIPNETSLNGNYTIEKGLFKIESGPSNGYGYNGDTHGSILKTGNIITLQVAGNTLIKLGGCIYSNGTVALTSNSGSFDVSSAATKASAEFHNDGTTLDFLYAGDAGTVTLTFTGTTYVPVIDLVPVPFEVNLTPWVKKSGTITINGTVISLTAGDDANSNATVTVSEGLVNSATATLASIRINLGGKALSVHTPELNGDIAAVNISGDTLKITYADAASNPKSYAIVVADNSSEVKAEAGKTYTYNFANGSVLPQTSYQALRYTTFVSNDGILTLHSNTETQSMQFGYHDASHGAVFFPGNSIEMIVAGKATITFGVCMYGSATDAVFEFVNTEGTVLGSIKATNISEGAEGTSSFSYVGEEGKITAILKSENHPTAEIYIHGLSIENAAELNSNGLVDVWDFGAEQLDENTYNNHLTETVINSWYDPSITPGSSNNVLPSFNEGQLSWVGGGNDRLRTTNKNLTRYDENIASVSGYTGRVYVNSGANKGRYMSLSLGEDDEVTIVAKTDAGGRLNFEYVPDPAAQTDQVSMTSDLTTLQFVAKAEGTYHLFDDQGKPSYYRIYRKDATYHTLSGNIDTNKAEGIPEGYALVFTNEAGKSWTSSMNGSSYQVQLPAGYSYAVSLANANGYIISSETSINVSTESPAFDVAILKVELFALSGNILGLGNALTKLSLEFTPDPAAGKIFKPSPVIDAENGSYTVQLEANCNYSITALGVNDYTLGNPVVSIGQNNTNADLSFAPITLYPVNISAENLNAEQLADLELTFTNLNEAGYAYTFQSVSEVELRDGIYTINASGLDAYPLQLGLTSNLRVESAETSKALNFERVTNWSFNDQVIANGKTHYKGLIFSGSISNEIAKGHLVTKPGSSIQVPVYPNTKLVVSYYYSADFSIEGGEKHGTSSGSTSTVESTTFLYQGTSEGIVTISIGDGAGTTYLTDITLLDVAEYQAVLEVGQNKTYRSINAALAEVRKMDRPGNERVNIIIDPGNYEEMLVVDVPNISLINAAANPGIGLKNKGVDIEANAVRITSYYGHGYNYYSMAPNQKRDEQVLQVNKENGYLSYANKGAGTTNGSYWNATVVVSASGFEAAHIIFENSFNQYISQKESDDVVEMWESGGKGIRPTDVGNTAVQNKAFVERAAAIAITNNTDKVVLNQCRVVGHQDSFFGGNNVRAVVYKGAMMGGTDYLFGGMNVVFYQTDLVLNTSDDKNDVAYITAAQQSSGRGYLMYECTVRSAIPGLENASTYGSKPGYFGRPWQATTSEVVFCNTTIEASEHPGFEGQSLIYPIGWLNSLGGESSKMYEFGTKEASGENNQQQRASWSTLLSEAVLSDGTAINPLNFTKGSDGWDPLSALIAADVQIPDFKVEKLLVGSVDSPEDYTCLLNLSWDASNVYVVLKITDDSIVNAGTNYQVDNIEVYFDMDNSKNIHWPRNGGWVSNDPTYDANDHQLRLVPDVDFSVNNSLEGAMQQYSQTPDGYRFELTIPWKALLDGFVPSAGTLIGFDILASDNDATASDANRNQLTLVSPTPNPYNDPSLFGTFRFEENGGFSIVPDNVAPGIVSGLTATSDQRSVTLAWENATDNVAILYYNVYLNGELQSARVYPKENGNTLKFNNLEDGDYTFEMETVDNFGNVSESRASVSTNITGVSVNTFSSDFSVYPNPVKDVLYIQGIDNLRQVEVIGITGNVIKKLPGAALVDVSELKKGIYILKVQTDRAIFSSRFRKD